MSSLRRWIPESTTPIFSRGNLLDRFFTEFDSFFDIISPKVDIKENDSHVIIKAEVPGLTREDISIEVENDILTISGEKELNNEEDTKSYYRTEISYGKFSRSFRVPEDVDVENIHATCSNGILTITIPKVESIKTATKIKID